MKNNPIIRLSVLLVFLAGLHTALAQPAIISTVPVDGATGVSPDATVVFTFSTAMNTSATAAQFIDTTVPGLAPVVSAWSAGNTVLTCTPSPAFGNNHSITWFVTGEDTKGNSLNGGIGGLGSFTTGSGGGGGSGGSGTNTVTSFVVGKSWQYNQTSTAAPALDPDYPYFFSGMTSLASNRTATAVTLTFPSAGVSNLVQNIVEPEDYYLYGYGTNLAAFNTAFPTGNYIFKVTSNAVNQQVTVNLPASTQPNAPRVTNYTEAQSINPSQPFTLTWDAFAGGGSPDYIFVNVGSVFETPGFGAAGALTGSATSVTIPSGTLMSDTSYDCTIGFYHAVFTTNSVGGYVTEAYVGTLTQFSINTGGSVAAAPVLTNATWNAGTFGFDILTTPGQMLTVVSSTNLNTASTTWPVLLTTNSPGAKVHISDPRSVTNRTLFYRVRNGN